MTKDQAIYVLEMNNPFMGGEEQRNLSEALDIAVKALEGKHYERAIFIPDGATNGDIIMAMFPNAWKSDYIDSSNHFTLYVDDKYEWEVDIDWWNAPYEGGKE